MFRTGAKGIDLIEMWHVSLLRSISMSHEQSAAPMWILEPKSGVNCCEGSQSSGTCIGTSKNAISCDFIWGRMCMMSWTLPMNDLAGHDVGQTCSSCRIHLETSLPQCAAECQK